MEVDGSLLSSEAKLQGYSSLKPNPKATVDVGVKPRLSTSAVRLFSTFLDPLTFLSHERNCIENLWWASFGSSRGVARLVAEGDSLPMELGAKFGLLEQLRIFAHLLRLGFQGGSDRYARLPSLRVHLFWSHFGVWTARIDPKPGFFSVLWDTGKRSALHILDEGREMFFQLICFFPPIPFIDIFVVNKSFHSFKF